jgi:hypothetical protein
MRHSGYIFLDFTLPNATTWFYFSALLAIALFFKFTRLLSLRNWDVLTLFLLGPGLLLLVETPGSWLGYLWLLAASGYFLVRCLADLPLASRPALTANLNLAGLVWLAGALFVSLVAVAIRQPATTRAASGEGSAAVIEVQKKIENLAEGLADRNGWRFPAQGAGVDFWIGRTVTVFCHLAIVLGLIYVGCRHFQDAHAGVAAATFYLLLPYCFLLLPYSNLGVGHRHHVWPMALIIWAVAAYRRPTVAGLLLGLATGLGLAAGTVYFPALLVPLWWSFYGKRGGLRFVSFFLLMVALCLISIGIAMWSFDDLAASIRAGLSISNWQPWRAPEQSTPGFWTGLTWAVAYRLPVFIAFLALLITTALWPSPKNLGHLLALSAAILLGIQFWYADQGGIYVFWYLPLLLLLVFRPNLTDRLPPVIHPETDWLHRLGRRLLRFVLWVLKLPNPPVQVG